MVRSQFSLSWNSFKNNICSGFTSLQQNGELVDMTLAADGHFVKVHQVLLALASPYLKDLIMSAPCQHPVLFLNNVSYKNMSLILEYIYTGEVLIPAESLTSFAEAAKGLHIKGLENINNESVNLSQSEDTNLGHVSGVKRLVVPTNDGVGQFDIPAAARNILVKPEVMRNRPKVEVEDQPTITSHNIHDYSDMEDNNTHDSDDFKHDNEIITDEPKLIKPTTNLQYTVSIRGSLQVILNRYIYNMQSTPSKKGIRRWRCIDYRNSKCLAFLVTKDNVVRNRANLHNHGFHDKKILAKIEKKCVFSAIDDAKGYKEKEDAKATDSDTVMEEGFGSIDFAN